METVKILDLLISKDVNNFDLGMVLMTALSDEQLIDLLIYLPTKAFISKPIDRSHHPLKLMNMNQDYVINERCVMPGGNGYQIEIFLIDHHRISIDRESVMIKKGSMLPFGRTFTKEKFRGISELFRNLINGN
jgi:hypothetical protein